MIFSDKIASVILVELEKLFSQIDFEYEKCVRFAKTYYAQEQFKTSQGYFSLTHNLVTFI